MNQRKMKKWPQMPPWLILTVILGVMLLGTIMFSRDYRREKGILKDIFLQRGEVLIHSLEMVARVRYGENWEESALQDFWSNLEDSDNVLFMALTDSEGRPLVVVGDTEPGDEIFRNPLPGKAEPFGTMMPHWRLEQVSGKWIYVVYRPFEPQPRPRRMKDMKHHGHSGSNWEYEAGGAGQERMKGRGREKMMREAPSVSAARYAWVGFNMSPFEAASRARVRTAAIFVVLFSLTGLAGVLALFWGHNSRLTRKMYEDTNALAAELIGRLPTGVIIQDSQGRVTLVNRSTLNISGLTEADFLGRTLEDVTFGRFPKEPTMNGREVELSFRGGQSVRVALTSGPVVSDDGHPLGQVILMEDLGEMGRLKAELAQKQRLATLGGLAAGLAHEIRNPLGAIRGLSQHLLNKGPADPADREALEVMLTSVDRLNSTITDFLDYARPTEIKAEPVDVIELLRNMATLVGHDAQSQSVEVTLELPPEPVMINGDESRLAQAFLNLYLNAIQAAGGREGEAGHLEVAANRTDEQVVITFHDDGPGFSQEQLDKAFVPYFTTKADGTGLGLAMVEKTVRAHEGADISLASPSAGGGLVTITFSTLADESR
ncbi:hypothetical protein C4J81_09685 [Deltaproteobacteria bacterium Smac51]|nr:hypothetical protein C4J81_09685 [Deltaproteobacteria bacterium Smac51]